MKTKYLLIVLVLLNSISVFAKLGEKYSVVSGTKTHNDLIYIYGVTYISTDYFNPNSYIIQDSAIGGFVQVYNRTSFLPIQHYDLIDKKLTNLAIDYAGNIYLSLVPLLNVPYSNEYLFKGDKSRSGADMVIIEKYSSDLTTLLNKKMIQGVSPRGQFAMNGDDIVFFSISALGQTDTSVYVTLDAFQSTYYNSDIDEAGSDFVITKFGTNMDSISYSSFLGGKGLEWVTETCYNSEGKLLLLGTSNGAPMFDSYYLPYGAYPTTPNSFEAKLPSDSVSKLGQANTMPPSVISLFTEDFSKLDFSSYFSYGKITDVSFDKDDNIIVTGWNRENDRNLPVGSFIAKFDKNFSKILSIKSFSTLDVIDTLMYNIYEEHSPTIVVYLFDDRDYFHYTNSNGEIIVVGTTTDPNLPVTPNAMQSKLAGGMDLAIYKLDKDFNIIYCSYYGSELDDKCIGIEAGIDPNKIIICGDSKKSDFPKNSKYKPNPEFNTKFVTMYDLNTTSIDETPSSFLLFPNPATEFINIDEAMLNGSNIIEIYNALGVKVLEAASTARINISELSCGIYSLKCGDRVQNFIKH